MKGIMKKNVFAGYEKTKPIKANFKRGVRLWAGGNTNNN